MLGTKIAGQERILILWAWNCIWEVQGQKAEREVAGGCESGKGGFSELTVVFRNMLVHFNSGVDTNMESLRWKMRIEIEVAKVRCVVECPKAEAFRPVHHVGNYLCCPC